MSDYKIIAFDMDGTLLNSNKTISPDSLSAIEKVFDSGNEVALSTGRCVAELNEYFELIPRLRYVVSTSGGLVYDHKTGEKIYSKIIVPELYNTIFDRLKGRDIMIQLQTADKSVVAESQESNMVHYQMGIYKEMYDRIATLVDDPITFIHEKPEDVYKINLYHTCFEERELTRKVLSDLDLELVNSEITSLECTPKGITKGIGLSKLCERLGFTIKNAVGVGDADNDLDVLSKVGLAVAMGNANERVKAIADVIVSDNDNGGCAQAIELMLK